MSLQPRIDPRSFRQVVQLEGRDATQDEEGQTAAPYRPWGQPFRADIHSVTGREFIASAAQQAGATHTIETYWRSDFDRWQSVVGMRARSGSRVFDIKTCDNVDMQNRLCRMMAVEGLRS